MRKKRKAGRRIGGGMRTTNIPDRGTIKNYFTNIQSTGMKATKRLADDLVEPGDDAPRMEVGAENDDGAAVDGSRKKSRRNSLNDIDDNESWMGAKSGSKMGLLGKQSVSSQREGDLGSWKLGMIKKNLECSMNSHGNSLWKGSKTYK